MIHVMLLSFWEFHENRLRAGRIFYGRHFSYIYTCTVTPCDILNVKNALVKSAYSVTECSISNLYCVCARVRACWFYNWHGADKASFK